MKIDNPYFQIHIACTLEAVEEMAAPDCSKVVIESKRRLLRANRWKKWMWKLQWYIYCKKYGLDPNENVDTTWG